ncbi:MAG: ABC transporter ATP-binding protein [Planctomycetes bacterium]|nr:ABC transporter ATP-binding protein [Planctomycetota bacterium]
MTLTAHALCAGFSERGRVIDQLDLRRERGRFTCLVGPNGAGKSTLMRCLAGVHHPEAGEVLLEEAPLSALSPLQRARKLGYLPQDVQPHFAFTVEEAVELGARVATPGKADIEHALRRMDAKHLRERSLQHLSGGERKRALIASVLAQQPDWLLLDEPTAMLDLDHQVGLFKLLRTVCAEGLGVLCITHDLNLAGRFADHLLLLNRGTLIATGTPREVLTQEHLQQVFRDCFHLRADGQETPVVVPQ